MVLELRPAHDPTQAYGFAGVVISLKDLSSSIWLWHRDREHRRPAGVEGARRSSTIPAEPADPAELPPLLQGFKAVPPLVTDINLSLDDRFLYVSCWGTGELRQYDVSDPFKPKLTGSIHLGGIVRRTRAPEAARTSRSTADRRWSRSAATAGGSTSPTRSITPWDAAVLSRRDPRLDGQDRRRPRAAAWRSIQRSSSSSTSVASASGPARGRRRVLRLVLLRR